MDDRISRLESAVEGLQLSVVSLQQRLGAIEAKVLGEVIAASCMATPSAAATVADQPPAAAQAKDPYDPIVILSLVGRLLLVLAGGFFLRALTDAGHIAVPVGIALAFAYASVWLFMSDRAGARGQVPNAVIHALAAAVVAFPLAVEATIRFKVLTGPSSALVVSVLSAGLLFVGWRRRLRGLVWITVVGALPASAALLVQTGVVAPFALYLVALGLATLWLSYSIDWWGARWPVAIAADVAVTGVALRAFAAEPQDAPWAAMLLLLLLLAGYLGSIAIRSLRHGHAVSRFEIVQTIGVLAVGVGGAVFMAHPTGAVSTALGLATAGIGAACYAVAVTVVDRREDGRLNLYFYTTLALVLVLCGFMIAFDGAWVGAAFALFGVLACGVWSRSGRLFMLFHGAVYVVAATIVSGLLGYCTRALLIGADGPWAMPNAVMLVVLAAAALCAALAARGSTTEGGELASAARLVIAIVLAWIASGAVVGFLAPVVGRLADRSLDLGVLSTVRTGVLSVLALVIAWMGGHARLREWGWLVYPLLVGIGLRLLAQDFKYSRPSTLFIALALYGAALIVAPRLRRRIVQVDAPTGA